MFPTFQRHVVRRFRVTEHLWVVEGTLTGGAWFESRHDDGTPYDYDPTRFPSISDALIAYHNGHVPDLSYPEARWSVAEGRWVR